MRTQFHKINYQMTQPLTEPTWSSKVDRWYQLDGPALALSELISSCGFEFDSLILACPESCNQTDLEFVQTGAARAQKFVHTLPNIRASMALQSIGKTCPVFCLLAGPKTIEEGLVEWTAQRSEGLSPALAVIEALDVTHKNPSYEAWILVAGPAKRTAVRSLNDH